MKRQPTTKAAPRPAPTPLDQFETTRHFDPIDLAKVKLEGTLAIAPALIDEGREHDHGIVLTLERHLKADLAALDAAYNAAREAILSLLYEVAFPKAPPMGTANSQVEKEGDAA